MVINYTINVPAIAAKMRPAVTAWFSANIQIVDPGTTDGTFNRLNNTKTGNAPTTLWTGSARVQPVRGVTDSDTGNAKTNLRGIEFQVPFDLAGQGTLRKGLQVLVLDGGEDDTLQNYRYVVDSGINSSGMWTRTIFAKVDLGAVQ